MQAPTFASRPRGGDIGNGIQAAEISAGLAERRNFLRALANPYGNDNNNSPFQLGERESGLLSRAARTWVAKAALANRRWKTASPAAVCPSANEAAEP